MSPFSHNAHSAILRCSLNRYLRDQVQDRIADENLGLARRLQAIRPQYDVDKWVCLICACTFEITLYTSHRSAHYPVRIESYNLYITDLYLNVFHSDNIFNSINHPKFNLDALSCCSFHFSDTGKIVITPRQDVII